MPVPQQHLDAFRQAFECQSSPCTYGSFTTYKDDLTLFYGKKGDVPRRLDFTDCTEDDLKGLAEYCDPATFGRNKEDVYDETYRKAGKLDSTAFSVNLVPERCGLIDNIRDLLLEGHDGGTAIRCELYKLNVYGPGSFFKEHKDTPRGQNMFATLVVVLPTVHEGGELVFRQNGTEFTFDSAAAVSLAPEPSVAFAAFFSDVTHEVLEVRSGYRVTLTWNLYFTSAFNTVTVSSALERNLADAFRALLADQTFLPSGGLLAFRLRHKYPIEAHGEEYRIRPLDKLLEAMKGSDAVLIQTCQALSLKPEVQMVYFDEGVEVLCPGTVYIGYSEQDVWRECCESGGKLLTEPPDDDERWDEERREWVDGTPEVDIQLEWLTEKCTVDAHSFATPFVAYGNEAELATVYSTPVLVVEVGPSNDRAGHAEPSAQDATTLTHRTNKLQLNSEDETDEE